jgi:hypothetical protein
MQSVFLLLATLIVSCDDGSDDPIDQAIQNKINEGDREVEGEAPVEQLNQIRFAEGLGGDEAPGAGSSVFLWKPVSERDRNLAILLPSSYRGRVSGCTISGAFGTEQGQFSGDDKNGYRPTYRFNNPGSFYGNNITVEARTLNSVDTWLILNGALRNEQ